MKKFDIKKLLIVMLALLLVFALVACNNGTAGTDDDDDGGGSVKPSTNNSITVEKYFTSLWDATATIGSDTFVAGDDVGLDLDLDIRLALEDSVIDLGVALSLVLDRDSEGRAVDHAAYNGGANSAAKVKLYNKRTGENWITVYYFLADPTNFYVTFMDQDIVVAASFNEKDNADFAKAVDGFINGKEILGGKTIGAILESILPTSSKTWNLDSILDAVLGLIQVDLDGEGPGEAAPLTIEAICGLLEGIAILNIDFGDGAKDSLLPVLNTLGEVLFPLDANGKGKHSTTKVAVAGEDGRYNYTAVADSGLLGIVGGMINLDIMTNDGLIGEGTELSLSFDTIEDATGKITSMEGFKINVLLADAFDEGDVEITIGINDLSLKNLGDVTETESATQLLGSKAIADFEEDFNISLDLEVAVKNDALVINPSEQDKIDCDGVLTLSLDAFIDLKGTGTAAVASLDYTKTGETTAANVAKASYGLMSGSTTLGQLILTVDDDVMVGDKSIVKMFGTYVGPMIVKALAGATIDVAFEDTNGNNIQDADETKIVETKPDELLNGAAVILANAIFMDNYADTAAILVDGATFTYDTNFSGVIMNNIDLGSLFKGLFVSPTLTAKQPVAAPTGEASADPLPKYASWQLGLGTLVKVIGNAITVENGVATISVSNIGNTLSSLFKNVTTEQMLFGRAAVGDPVTTSGIDGWFGNDGTANKAKGWWSKFFEGSSWYVSPGVETQDNRKDMETLRKLFQSNAKVTLGFGANGFELGANVTNGSGSSAATVDLSLAIKVEEGKGTYEQITANTGVGTWATISFPIESAGEEA